MTLFAGDNKWQYKCDCCDMISLDEGIEGRYLIPDSWHYVAYVQGWNIENPDNELHFCSPECLTEFFSKPVDITGKKSNP